MRECDDRRYFKSDAIFAASNSAGGFKSYYDEVFKRSELERLYIIKGGPGTGKSRFMKRVVEYATSLGYYVESYRCSSDPESLDGIIIDGRIGFLDGTAPHSFDAELVGARDEIINLGEFWDSDKLAQRVGEIKELSARKKEAYIKGYRYLSGCGSLDGIMRALIFPALKEKKLMGYVTRILSDIPLSEGGEITPAIVDSVGMKGRVRFDSYEKCAEKLYSVSDAYGTAYLFIAAIITAAKRKGIDMRISYDPIIPDKPDGVFFCGYGIAFVKCEAGECEYEGAYRVNMKRFLDKDILDRVKKEYRYDAKLYDALLSSACDSFAEAGESHFELEKIYSECMDFGAKERFTASFCEMLGQRLGR